MRTIWLLFLLLAFVSLGTAQPGNTDDAQGVPRFVSFTSVLLDLQGKPKSGICGITFALYQEQDGGAPVWLETINVNLDKRGQYTVLLGSSKPTGIPSEAFQDGVSRWLGVIPDDGVERARVKLSSVPYAMASTNAEMLGGRPASEFVTKAELNAAGGNQPSPWLDPGPWPDPSPGAFLKAFGFDALSPTGPSFISRATSGPPFLVQSGALVTNLNADMLHGHTDSDLAKLSGDNDFGGLQKLRMGLLLFPSIPSGASSSATVDFQARTQTPDPNVMSDRVFRWVANPLAAPQNFSARLNLLFGADNTAPSPSGLGINEDGTIQFASNQGFPSQAILEALGNGGPGVNGDPAQAPIVYTAPYSWKQTPVNPTPIQTGWNSVQLSPCPVGVNGTDVWHYLYISGSGTPEAVLITGGTCVSGASKGTIEFSAANPHPSGYVIGSATAGIQEAVNAAALDNHYWNGSRSVVITPGELTILARLSIRGSGIDVSGFGATLNCSMDDVCVMLGDPSNSNMYTRIRFSGVRMRPAFPGGILPAIEDNAQGSQINGVSAASNPDGKSRFGYMIQVDNDQAANIDRFEMLGQGALRCDEVFCGAALYAPGPFSTRAAVGWISHADLNMQCGGNGVDWNSGNTVQISDSVIEGYSQFGVRGGLTTGGYGNIKLNNVYFEDSGSCPNPLDGSSPSSTGTAGVIVRGGQISISGGEGPGGHFPLYANTQGTTYRYYVVPRLEGYGNGNPLLAGNAVSNGVGNITVKWPDIPGATSFDLLKTQAGSGPYGLDVAPNGTGNYALATGLLRASVCSGGICAFVDTQAAPSNYTVQPIGFFPRLDLWPGAIVLAAFANGQSSLSASTLEVSDIGIGVVGLNTVLGNVGVSLRALHCPEIVQRSTAWIECQDTAMPPNSQLPEATVFQTSDLVGFLSNLKGRVNMGTLRIAPNHIITLSDSNFAKTVSTQLMRPLNDPSDAYIGYDQMTGGPATVGISFGAPASLSNYIGNNGDGVNWQERLTATLKEFKTDVQIDGNLIVKGSIVQGKQNRNVAPSRLPQTNAGIGGAVEKALVPERESRPPQQFTYSLTEKEGTFATGTRISSVYVNRAATLRLSEIYCEVDTGKAIINLLSAGRPLLTSALECTPSGSASTTFAEDRQIVDPGERLDHDTISISPGIHSLRVVLSYVVE